MLSRFVAAFAIAVCVLGLTTISAEAQEPERPDPQLGPSPLGDRSDGRADAPIVVFHYLSLICGCCAQVHANLYPTLKSKFIDTGKIRYIVREVSLDNLDAAAAMTARCVPRENYFAFIAAALKRQSEWIVQ